VARTACPERRSLTSSTNRCWLHGGPNGLDRDPLRRFRARCHQRAEAPDLVTSCPIARRHAAGLTNPQGHRRRRNAARQPAVGSGTTLFWLVKHLTRAEILWIVCRFADKDATVPDDAVQPGDTVTAVIGRYRAVWAQTDAIALAASLDEPCRRISGDAPVSLRWVLMHLLEETARHAGHADISVNSSTEARAAKVHMGQDALGAAEECTFATGQAHHAMHLVRGPWVDLA
jgi:hypothetical protein